MRVLVFFSLVLLLVGCGAEQPVDDSSYRSSFSALASAAGHTVDLNGIEIVSGYVQSGWEKTTCGTGGQRTVISSAVWDAASDAARRIMVYHVLGHCALSRSHLNMLTDADTRPFSLMNAGLVTPDSYSEHETAYTSELFSPPTSVTKCGTALTLNDDGTPVIPGLSFTRICHVDLSATRPANVLWPQLPFNGVYRSLADPTCGFKLINGQIKSDSDSDIEVRLSNPSALEIGNYQDCD